MKTVGSKRLGIMHNKSWMNGIPKCRRTKTNRDKSIKLRI